MQNAKLWLIHYFRRIYGDPFIEKDKSAHVNELQHKRRGRPLLLGELDKLVHEQLLQLRAAGGIMNRNIAISTACGIVYT